MRHGAWTERYQNGPKRFEGRYAHGERVGKFTHWRSDGQRTQVVDYQDGKAAPIDLYTYVRAAENTRRMLRKLSPGDLDTMSEDLQTGLPHI